MGNACGRILGTTRVIGGDEKYVETVENQLLASLKETANWKNERVEAPDDDPDLDHYSKISAQIYGIDENLLPRVSEVGAANTLKNVDEAAKEGVLKAWPSMINYNFKNKQDMLGKLFSPKVVNGGLSLPAEPPHDMGSPEGLAWFFTHGVGGVMLKADSSDGNKFIVDTGPVMRGIEMKEGFDELCVVVHLEVSNGTLVVVSIEEDEKTHKPGDDGFGFVCRKAATAVFTIITAQHHGLYAHLITTDAFTYAGKAQLKPNHPIRRFLCRCEYGNHKINEAAVMQLLSFHGAFEHYFNMSNRGLNELLARAKSAYNMHDFQTSPGVLAAAGIEVGSPAYKAIPVLSELDEWWNVLRSYSADYIALYYPDDESVKADEQLQRWYNHIHLALEGSTAGPNLVDSPNALEELIYLSTTYMYVSTAYHEVIGAQTYDLVASPYIVSSSWRTGKSTVLEEKLSPVYVAIIRRNAAASTTVRSPVFVQKWGHHALKDDKHAEASAVLDSIVERADGFDAGLKSRNQSRQVPYTLLQSRNLECSIAV